MYSEDIWRENIEQEVFRSRIPINLFIMEISEIWTKMPNERVSYIKARKIFIVFIGKNERKWGRQTIERNYRSHSKRALNLWHLHVIINLYDPVILPIIQK